MAVFCALFTFSLDLSCFQVGLLMAYLYLLRWISNNTVIYLFDKLSRHYSVFLILFCSLVGFSALSVFLLLSSYSSLLVGGYLIDHSSSYYWYIVFAALSLFGAFYLSLGVLIESVILKSWGEYRMYFYGHHRPWSEWTVVFLTGLIGVICSLFSIFCADEDQCDPSDLLPPLFTGMILLGVCVMCMIALFKIQFMPSDPTSLGLTPSTPWLLKNAVVQPSDLLLLPSYFAPYKPYSLFGESLSHISEENASMVQRMTSHPSLIREPSRTSSQSAYSFTATPIPIMNNNNANNLSLLSASGTPSSYGAMIYSSSTTGSAPTVDNTGFIPSWLGSNPLVGRRLSGNTSYSYDPTTPFADDDDDIGGDETSQHQQHHQQQQQQQGINLQSSSWDAVPSYELALFSFVPPDMPSIAMLPFILHYFNTATINTTNNNDTPRYSTPASATTAMMSNTYIPSIPGPLLINPPPVEVWKLRSLQLTMFLLGCDSAMLQVFLFVYLYDCLDLSILIVGMTGALVILSNILLLTTVTKWIHGINFTGMTTLIHATLIICSFSFLWLRPHHVFTTIAALILPFMQSGIFYLAWLVASDRINTLVWSDQQRIFQRAVVSTLFCYVGPMVGAMLTGYLVSSSEVSSGTGDDILLHPSSFTPVYHASIGLLAFSFVVSWGWSTDE
ncbi:unnamed protein product [Absidia cylindrospora]